MFDGVKLPIIFPFDSSSKRNEVEAQTTSSVLNKRYDGYRKNGMETN